MSIDTRRISKRANKIFLEGSCNGDIGGNLYELIERLKMFARKMINVNIFSSV